MNSEVLSPSGTICPNLTASLYTFAGEREEAGAALRDVLAHDSQNPYYLWMAYGRQ
jgi:hypothetical protein